VSSQDRRSDLGRPVARATEWATTHGRSVAEVVTEIGSALQGRRRKLARLLSDATATTIVVEHRDR
jgi:putative resolvase